MPSEPNAVFSSGMFGRDTDATRRQWPSIVASVGIAPSLFQGPLPRKSPENRRFRLPRYRGQLIGCCVGENTTSMCETLLRMPEPREADSKPLDGTGLSPLWVYWLARKWSRDHGVNLGGEGAIVSHAIQALNADGVVGWDRWPATDDAYRQYSDRIRPGQDIESEADSHPVKEMAILDSWDAILHYLAGGFTVSIGVPIPAGITQTNDDGMFRWSGRTIGGHCMELLDYDMDSDRVWLGNSWANARWGARSDDPAYQGKCQGHSNIGQCSLTDLEKVFHPSLMANGTSEAVVTNNVVGWRPKYWRQFIEVI